MSEDLYAKLDLAKKVRFQAGETKDGNTDDGKNIDNVIIYDNCWAEGSAAPKSEDNTSDHQQPSICLSVCVCLSVSYVWYTWDTVFVITGEMYILCWGILYISDFVNVRWQTD